LAIICVMDLARSFVPDRFLLYDEVFGGIVGGWGIPLELDVSLKVLDSEFPKSFSFVILLSKLWIWFSVALLGVGGGMVGRMDCGNSLDNNVSSCMGVDSVLSFGPSLISAFSDKTSDISMIWFSAVFVIVVGFEVDLSRGDTFANIGSRGGEPEQE